MVGTEVTPGASDSHLSFALYTSLHYLFFSLSLLAGWLSLSFSFMMPTIITPALTLKSFQFQLSITNHKFTFWLLFQIGPVNFFFFFKASCTSLQSLGNWWWVSPRPRGKTGYVVQWPVRLSVWIPKGGICGAG